YLLDGLEALEYRGYDSAGVALMGANRIRTTKVVGRVDALRKELGSSPAASCGIGHTRWATHGGVVQKNAHPLNSQSGEFSVIHNGIIENYQEVRSFLKKQGYRFKSDTDTEVIPNLVDYHYRQSKDVEQAFLTAIKLLRGAYAIVLMSIHTPGKLYAAK